MSVGILLVTHDNIGQVMLDTALTNLGRKDIHVRAFAIPFDCDPDQRATACNKILSELDEGQGVLILTDLYGATPSNIAHKIGLDAEVKVVAGVNLPMLMRVLNYAHLDLTQLVEKAVTGGKEGVVSD